MITWLRECTDPRAAGGKAFNLARMLRAGLPVPNGFVVEANALRVVTLPALRTALQELNAKSVAVRSSAAGEDSADHSFAGIYQTRLHVKSADDVLAALSDVVNSVNTPGATAYRQGKGITEIPSIAALVQTLIPAEAAGVLVTQYPRGPQSVTVIEGAWGLGESVVSGRVTPDRWEFSATGRWLSSTIADKEIETVPAASGTQDMPVPRERRGTPCLRNDSLPALVQLARQCEELLEGPQNIEWAFHHERFWLLQSRPIPVTPR